MRYGVMRLPWTLELIRDMRRFMDVPSVFRLRNYLVRVGKTGGRANKRLSLNMRSPIHGRIFLRERGSDIRTFKEVLEEQVYSAVLAKLPACRTIIDLGANIGLTSLYLAAHFPDSHLFSVEPNADTYDVLRSNLQRLIADGRCRILQGAVWSAERPLVADASQGADHFSAFATREPSVNDISETTIAGYTMARIIAESGFSFIDLVKVDIEGAEVQLLKGDRSWLNRVGAIAIEFHGESRSTSAFDEIMAEHHFTIRDDGSHTVLATKNPS
jgi:FkbM family methyltransferase